MNSNVIKLIVSIGICQAAGGIGGLFTSTSVRTWYTTINKPSFNPPNWIFGPVWITLYLLMGIALYFIWTSDSAALKMTALSLFYAQLVLNVLWSFSFFYMKSPFYSLLVILVLVIMIALTMVYCFKIRPLAGYLMVPYILWVGFATVLNFALWRLNS